MQGLILKIITLIVAIVVMATYLQPLLLKLQEPWGLLIAILVWLGIIWFIIGGYLKLS